MRRVFSNLEGSPCPLFHELRVLEKLFTVWNVVASCTAELKCLPEICSQKCLFSLAAPLGVGSLLITATLSLFIVLQQRPLNAAVIS